MTYTTVFADFHASAEIQSSQEVLESQLIVFGLLVKTEGQPYLSIDLNGPNGDGLSGFSFSIYCLEDGTVTVAFSAVDTSLNNIGSLTWAGPAFNTNTVYSFVASVDTVGQRSHCWINGTECFGASSWPATPLPLIGGTATITLESNSDNFGYVDLCLGNLYLSQPGTFLASDSGFWADGAPVDPGPYGGGPTGYDPLVMLFLLPSDTDPEQFKVNRSPNGATPFTGSALYFCEAIFLNTPSGVVTGVPPAISGTDSEVILASALDYQLDGGGWVEDGVASFVPSPGYGEVWEGIGPAAGDGTHVLQVRNSGTISVLSNFVTYTIGGMTGITLNQIYDAMDGIPPSISGIDYESPVAMLPLQYLLDSATGGVWMEEVEEFVPAIAEGDTWTGFGPPAGPGTHTLQVRSVFGDSIAGATSNEITYIIQDDPPPPDDDCCVPLPSNTLGRYRGAVGINFFGKTLIGDAFSGVIGSANFDTFTEYGNTMRALVAAPPIHSDRKRVFIPRFELDIESGVGQPECCGYDPQWMLDWSKDGGRTWSEVQVFRGMGRIGEFTRRLRWLRMGQARQWVFRLQSTDPVRRVIIGAYVDTYEGMG